MSDYQGPAKCEVCMDSDVFTMLCERCYDDSQEDVITQAHLDAAVKAAVKAENQRCRKVIDDLPTTAEFSEFNNGYRDGLRTACLAIRAVTKREKP